MSSSRPPEAAVDAPPGEKDLEWLVLADADGQRGTSGRPSGWVYGRLAALTAVVLVVVALVAGLLSLREAEREAVVDATQRALLLSRTVVEPALPEDLAALGAGGAGRLDAAVKRYLPPEGVVRVKLWDADGRILYSDDPGLVGRQYVLDEAERKVLLGDEPSRAVVSDLTEPENQFEVRADRLLEVYTRVQTTAGTPLLFETYFSYDGARDRVPEIWRGFALITFSSVALLMLLLLPVVWQLVKRLRRTQEEREMLLVQAAEAATAERRRIANTLHDGVVQDLAATAFILSGAASSARQTQPASLVTSLDRASSAVRRSIGGLRALLVEIHPPSLAATGLDAVLVDLVEGPLLQGVEAHLELPPVTRTRLDRAGERLVFRVAQECLRNVARHSQAKEVTVRLADLDGALGLTVTDDGVGFDPEQVLRDRHPDHYGLRLMIDAAREAGATLRVRSAPGRGTRWELEVRARDDVATSTS